MIFAPLFLGVIVLGGFWVDALCLLLSAIMLWEFLAFSLGEPRSVLKAVIYLDGLLLCGFVLGLLPVSLNRVVLPLTLVGALLATLWEAEPLQRSIARVAISYFGALYCSTLLPYLALLRHWPVIGLPYTLLVIACTWGADTTAYFAGRALGKHKLYLKISPGKTWEGFVAGLLASLLIAWVLVGLLPISPALSAQDAIFTGIMSAFLGLLGDLAESMLKRASNVKDSSALIPGHGGVLDRFDSLLFTLPGCYVYLCYKTIETGF
jgi:phosphatidate cytidylyltransferase